MENSIDLSGLIELFNKNSNDWDKDVSMVDFFEISFGVVRECFGIDKSVLQSKTRKRTVVDARAMISAKAKEIFDKEISLAKIGFFLGNKNHATVLNGIKKHYNLCLKDKDYNRRFFEFSELVSKKFILGTGTLSYKEVVKFLKNLQKHQNPQFFENFIERLTDEALSTKFMTNKKLQDLLENFASGQI